MDWRQIGGHVTKGGSVATKPNVLRFLLTLTLVFLFAYTVGRAYGFIHEVPTRDPSGNTLDVYQRSVDLIQLILPLVTIAMGYWFGAAGKDQAEQAATAASDKLTVTKQQLGIVMGAAGPDVVEKAKQAYPQVFGRSSD